MHLKKILLTVVLLGSGLALAQLFVDAMAYYPVIKVASLGGIEFTLVHDATGNRQACGVENRKFLEPLKKQCKECKVVYARCERQLEGAELALSRRETMPHYVVSASNLRMLVTGPSVAAKRACEDVAANMVKNGLQTAACLYPHG